MNSISKALPITPSKRNFLRVTAQMHILHKQKTYACLQTVTTHRATKPDGQKRRMKKYLAIAFFYLVLTSFDDPDEHLFKVRPKLKSITEWVEITDTTDAKAKKWIRSYREYYPNGQLKTYRHVYKDLDTSLITFHLNKDSVIDESRTFNKSTKKWARLEKYSYLSGSKYPDKITSKYNSWKYIYDKDGRLLRRALYIKKNIPIDEYDYIYDASGTIAQVLRYSFLKSNSGEPTEQKSDLITVDEYSFDPTSGTLTKKTFFISAADEKIDRTIYSANKIAFSTTKYKDFNPEKIFVSEKNELIKRTSSYMTSVYKYEYYN